MYKKQYYLNCRDGSTKKYTNKDSRENKVVIVVVHHCSMACKIPMDILLCTS